MSSPARFKLTHYRSRTVWDDICHAYRWNPARVLAECAAKRRIVAQFNACDTIARKGSSIEGQRFNDGRAAGLEDAIGHLAAVHADHPDYREEWRP